GDQVLALLHAVADGALELEEAADGGAHPAAGLEDGRAALGTGGRVVDHLPVLQHAEHAGDAGVDGAAAEAEGLAGFVEEHADAAVAGGPAERAAGGGGVDDGGRAEGLSG